MDHPTSRAGAIAIIVASIAGLAMMAFELTQPALGFDDTDSPATTLSFLATHADVWVRSAYALFALAGGALVGAFAVFDVLSGRAGALALRSVTAIGIFSAAAFFGFGVLRAAVAPLQYIAGLDRTWGESAFLVIQVAGVHGLAQAGILTFCGWAVGIGVLGYRSRALPRALCLLAVLPGLRLLLLALGPIGAASSAGQVLPDVLWIVAMLTIPGTFAWSLVLGLVLLRRSVRGTAREAGAPA